MTSFYLDFYNKKDHFTCMAQGKDAYGKKVGGNIARHGKVTGGMTGLAVKLAGEKFLGIKIDRDKHAEQLLSSLGNLKGPMMKIGQILATIPEALPPEYSRALQELQSNAPPMSWNFVRRRMKAELGADWQGKFKSFEKEASAAASLGQVHKAISHDGRDLACKLQYPDMEGAIAGDLKQLRLAFSLYKQYDKSIKTENVHAELSERLAEELDYELEAKHTRLFADILSGEENVYVPEVIDELSTRRLLSSAWLEGEHILSLKGAPLEVRNDAAMNLFRAWYVPLYNYGVIHGDPHLGNYTIRSDIGVNLLDFGCVRFFPAEFVGGVIDLYFALLKNDRDLAVHAFETWGFEGLSNEQIETLSIWAKFLYEPLLEDRVRIIGSPKGGMYGRETAQKVHRQLRELSEERGGIAIPREFVFMDRAALGLGSVFIHLNAEVNWYQLFNGMIERFDVDGMRNNQKKIQKKHDIPN